MRFGITPLLRTITALSIVSDVIGSIVSDVIGTAVPFLVYQVRPRKGMGGVYLKSYECTRDVPKDVPGSSIESLPNGIDRVRRYRS